MKLIAGLGNPGSRYAKTRHNAGFMVVDRIAEKCSCAFRPGKGDYELAETNSGEQRVLLVKPTTYMNNSGLAIRELVQFYKIPLKDVLVICDDVALPFGKIRFRPSGSDGGQNGLKSVIFHLNSDEFPRLRIGIANDRLEKMNLADFVLSRFDAEEMMQIPKIVETAARGGMEFIDQPFSNVMNQYNAVQII